MKTRGAGKTLIRAPSGQVIVEYVLLLLISTVLALGLIALADIDPSAGSPVFKYWKSLLEVIGSDISS